MIPTNSPKIDHLKRLNVNVKLHGTDCLESEMFAKQYAEVQIYKKIHFTKHFEIYAYVTFTLLNAYHPCRDHYFALRFDMN